LRELTEAQHKVLKEIVVGGALRAGGMPSFPDLTDDDLEALRAYLINQAWARYERH